MNSVIKIGDKNIGKDFPPFVIAEMSGNHNQSLERALEIVDLAAKSGATAIKLQTYSADSMTLDCDDGLFSIKDSGSLWSGKSLYKLYSEAYTPWEWHKPIFERAQKHGLICFSSPFDLKAVDFLEELNVPCYKIASFENNYTSLIKKVAKTGKPVIISTGMATLTVLQEIISTFKDAGGKDLILLKCTSTYPATPMDSNLVTIPHMSEMLNVHVGLSDHTMGIGVSVASVALGARVIEKHFTTSRADGGVDSAFSMEPDEFSLLVKELNNAWMSLGKVNYAPTVNEIKSLQFRRSIYVSQDINSGDKFSEENIRVIRPGGGLEPKYYDQLIGKKANRDFKKGTPLSLESIL